MPAPVNFPYTDGKTLTLRTEAGSDISQDLQLQIVKCYHPSTLSCVMEVDMWTQSRGAARAILKLYDPRFAKQLRDDHEVGVWTEDHETAYVKFVSDGLVQDFLDKLRSDDGRKEAQDGWSLVEIETYLYNYCLDMYKAETSVYARLREYQGQEIPRLYNTVSLNMKPPGVGDDISADLFDVKGILLEYIPGFTLAQLGEHAPRESWQSIVDHAIQASHILGDHNILNEDVRSSNFMVAPDATSRTGYRVVMLDFGQCRLRGKNESDFDWGRAKWNEDDEGAIGAIMQTRLKIFGFELRYEGSMRYLEWAEREGVEER